MNVKTNIAISAVEEGDNIITTTIATEEMSIEKFRATYAQREAEVKQLHHNLKTINGMLEDIDLLKRTRDINTIKKLVEKIVRPEGLIKQKEQCEIQIAESNSMVQSLKALFDKIKDKTKENIKDKK